MTGYRRNAAGDCTDIDECALGTDTCDESVTCTNTVGSFTCGACAEGFVGTGARGCFDVDECALGVCDALTTCTNMPGSFSCSACPAGYEGDGRTGCVRLGDARTCADAPCDALTTCTDSEGGFVCSACPAGYAGTGARGCFDVDECTYNVCDSRTTCTNTPGSFTCSECPEGFEGDPRTGCVNVDECAASESPCEADEACFDREGTFECVECGGEGFAADPVTGACVDVNECELGLDDCAEDRACVNGPGTFACAIVRPIATGESHACAVLEDGTVKCWGDGGDGKLGNGTDRQRFSPTLTLPLDAPAVSVASFGYHTCAILADGTVSCWGANYSGQLGDGESDSWRPVPKRTLPLGDLAVDLALGYEHTCALLASGDVTCWGYGANGEIGDGSTNNRETPGEPVALGGRATRITSGGNHICALLDDATVTCWGSNGQGQLGDGTTDRRTLPTATLSLGGDVVDLDAGTEHTCALLADGTIKCWGYNGEGALGDGTLDSHDGEIVDASSVAGEAIGLTAGGYFTCALLASGDVNCWGANSEGQLGDGTRDSRGDAKPVLNLPSDFSALAAGYSYVCAIYEADRFLCWGANGGGQLGIEGFKRSTTPTPTASLGGTVIDVENGNNWSCAVLDDGALKCWGNNGNGQLGIGTYTGSEPTPVSVDVGGRVIKVSASMNNPFMCAVLDDGAVKCWGYNGNGQLGDGTTSQRATPGSVSLPRAATDVVTGCDHTCALLDDGTVHCWGHNGNGQLGNGDTSNRTVPVATQPLAGRATELATACYTTCALIEDGSVQCWGYGYNGELGYGANTQTTQPGTAVSFDEPVVSLGSGGWYVCAVVESGKVMCWGSGGEGQLGNGSRDSASVPVQVAGLTSDATSVGGGWNHVCASLADGTVSCWGYNYHGQLGDGTVLRRLVATSTAALGDLATSVSVGGDHSCASLADGTVSCWGWNGEGRLGLGYDGNAVSEIFYEPYSLIAP